MRNSYSILVGKPEGKRPLGSSRRNGKLVAQFKDQWQAFVDTVMNLRVQIKRSKTD
jgi:hypothetical protein